RTSPSTASIGTRSSRRSTAARARPTRPPESEPATNRPPRWARVPIQPPRAAPRSRGRNVAVPAKRGGIGLLAPRSVWHGCCSRPHLPAGVRMHRYAALIAAAGLIGCNENGLSTIPPPDVDEHPVIELDPAFVDFGQLDPGQEGVHVV